MGIDPTNFQNEIAEFKKWLRDYGPYAYLELEDSEIAEINPYLIWSVLSLDDEDYIANCFEEDEECYGFYVASKPYVADEGTIFVTTKVNVPCEANDDCDPDCQNCGGLGYTKIDIEELSKNFTS